jgi:hypothetical protein
MMISVSGQGMKVVGKWIVLQQHKQIDNFFNECEDEVEADRMREDAGYLR